MKEILIEAIELFQEKIDLINCSIDGCNSDGHADDELYDERDYYERLQFDAQLEIDRL